MLAAALALQLTTVLVFTTTDCPISNRYAPEIQRLSEKYEKDFKFIFVYPVPSDSDDKIREHRRKFGGGDWQRDASQVLVKFTGATVTPEVAVVTGDKKILYRGRIDDRYIAFGKDRPQPTVRDLERSLDAIIAGRPVPVARTQAIGCYLPDLVK
jgi:thiol-disulfide isomerase/thioredoxin